MRRKILILANNSGGLYDFRHELIEELEKKYEIYASTPFDDKVTELTTSGCHLIETEMDRRGINPIRDFRLLRTYRRIISDVKPDLILTYTIKPNIYGGLIARQRHIPYAVNITGLGTAFQKNNLLKRMVIKMYRISLRRAKVVFFENEENKNVFLSEKIVTAHQTCLLNGAGVNLKRYEPTPYPVSGNTTRFLFMGRVMKEKGVDELFTVFQRLAKEGVSCELDVLGNCEEDYQKVIENYELEGWLHYHGYQTDVRPYIARAHCFVLPSWHEGMANTNLECAAMARPVITSNIHGCLEAVEDGVSGYLCERQDADSLYKVIRKFVKLSWDERKAMGLAGRKRMEERFDKRMVVGETVRRLAGREICD